MSEPDALMAAVVDSVTESLRLPYRGDRIRQ